MVYIEQRPHAALAAYIRCYWYAYDPHAEHGLERVPAGRTSTDRDEPGTGLSDGLQGRHGRPFGGGDSGRHTIALPDDRPIRYVGACGSGLLSRRDNRFFFLRTQACSRMRIRRSKICGAGRPPIWGSGCARPGRSQRSLPCWTASFCGGSRKGGGSRDLRRSRSPWRRCMGEMKEQAWLRSAGRLG